MATDNFNLQSFLSTSSYSFTLASLRAHQFGYRQLEFKANPTYFCPWESWYYSEIPLSSRLTEDKQIWFKTPNGLFNIRSAYKVAMEMFKAKYFMDYEFIQVSMGNNHSYVWKSIVST